MKTILFLILLSFNVYANETVCFSPEGKCTDLIVQEINTAQNKILCQAYSFTSEAIATAIHNANKRGVIVEIIFDKGQEKAKSSIFNFFKNINSIDTYLDCKHAIAHNKIIIIDDVCLITGSFNFTVSAEKRNAENLIILKDNKQVIGLYIDNFYKHKAHSKVIK